MFQLSQKIDGAKIARLFEKTVLNDIATINQLALQKYPNLPPRRPSIVSFCNQDDPSSVKYTQLKKSKAEELGIEFKIVYLHPDTTLKDVQNLMNKFNSSGVIDGIMVQLPIIDHLKSKEQQIINLISPDKDVDGLTVAGSLIFRPATIEGIFQLLQTQNTTLQGKTIAVVGSEGTIGKKLTEELLKNNPSQLIRVDKLFPKTSIDKDLQNADIVFSCIPGKGLIKAKYLKRGVIVYDIGLGNFTPDVYEIASEYTPITGGVGPNTVVALMRNVAKAYDLHLRLAYDL